MCLSGSVWGDTPQSGKLKPSVTVRVRVRVTATVIMT